MMDLRNATGQGVRVAVVDSGVNAHHPHVGRVAQGMGIVADGDIPTVSQDFRDPHGHGTACAAVIRWGAPGAEIVAVRALDRHLTATTAVLRATLDSLADLAPQVINLSLGAPAPDTGRELAAATDRLLAAGIHIVSAVRGDGAPSWPSSHPGVVAVTADPDLPGWTYTVGAGSTTFAASPFPRPIPGQPPQRNFAGTSFAAPRVAALMARALELDPALTRDQLVSALIDNAPHFDSRGSGHPHPPAPDPSSPSPPDPDPRS